MVSTAHRAAHGASPCRGVAGKLLNSSIGWVTVFPFFLVLLLFCHGAGAATDVVVLYPQAPDPYKSAYRQIMQGIASPDVHVSDYQLSGTEDHSLALRTWIADKGPRAIIALGSDAAHAAQAAKSGLPIYVGATVLPPGETQFPGISRQVDPRLVISQLQKLRLPLRRPALATDRQHPLVGRKVDCCRIEPWR